MSTIKQKLDELEKQKQAKRLEDLQKDMERLRDKMIEAQARRRERDHYEWTLNHLKSLNQDDKIALFNALVLELACT